MTDLPSDRQRARPLPGLLTVREGLVAGQPRGLGVDWQQLVLNIIGKSVVPASRAQIQQPTFSQAGSFLWSNPPEFPFFYKYLYTQPLTFH